MITFLAEDFRILINKINSSVITEGDNSDDDQQKTVSFNDIKKCMVNISKISPITKVHTIKLLTFLTDGIKDKPENGGMTAVILSILEAINLAIDSGVEDSMTEVVKLVSTIEGDENAIDQAIFPQIVIELILICGEISNNNK